MSRRGNCSRSRGQAWLAFVVLCSFVTGCAAQSGDGNGTEVRDFSDFTEFAFSREPGLGFCPLFDAVFDATIVLNEDGQYVASISALVEPHKVVHASAKAALDAAAVNDLDAMTENLKRLDDASVQVLGGLEDLSVAIRKTRDRADAA